MNILVTGASGFIGKSLVTRLVADKANHVICLVRPTSSIESLKPLGVSFVYGDITDYSSLPQLNYPIDVLFHCAAYVENRNPARLHAVNITGSQNIFQYAMEKHVKRVVYLSSVAVLSGNPQVILVDAMPYVANNNYGISKIGAERLALEYRAKGLKIAIIRPAMVYGPQEPHLMKILLFLLRRKMLPLVNEGRQTLHMVYLETVVDSLIFAMRNDLCLNNVCMIADKEVLTTAETVTIMADALGVKPPKALPYWLEQLLIHLPFIGKQVKSFKKDRQYSTQTIEGLGFKFNHNGRSALADSVRNFDKK